MADNDGPITLRTRKFIRNPLLGRKQMVVYVVPPPSLSSFPFRINQQTRHLRNSNITRKYYVLFYILILRLCFIYSTTWIYNLTPSHYENIENKLEGIDRVVC